MSELREYIDKHPGETKRLVGLDHEQLISLIVEAEKLNNRLKVTESNKKKLKIESYPELKKKIIVPKPEKE